MKLSVNIDHIATLREARRGVYPDPVHAAVLCELAGADGITFHLREDRRHIKERDVSLLKDVIHIKLNMEMANTSQMLELAQKYRPHQITLVPEKRQELTTEGGLDIAGNKDSVKKTVDIMRGRDIMVSLFIDPCREQIDSAVHAGAGYVELHTGMYANAEAGERSQKELDRLKDAAVYAHKAGLRVFAGHGLNMYNLGGILNIPYIEELNIGHSIISRSVFAGMERAVKEVLERMPV